MPGEPAAEPCLEPALVEIDVVVNDEYRLDRRLEEAGCSGDRLTGLVHVRLGLDQREAGAAEAPAEPGADAAGEPEPSEG